MLLGRLFEGTPGCGRAKYLRSTHNESCSADLLYLFDFPISHNIKSVFKYFLLSPLSLVGLQRPGASIPRHRAGSCVTTQ